MNLGLKGALMLAPLLASGCSIFGGGGLDGTWLIKFDPNVAIVGECEDSLPEDGEYTYLGIDNQLMDIYHAESGYVVLMNGMYLYGNVVDGTLHATFAEAEEGDDYETAHTVDFRGAVDGGILTGSVVTFEMEEIGEADPYDCATTATYTAEKIVSDPDTYDVGQEE